MDIFFVFFVNQLKDENFILDILEQLSKDVSKELDIEELKKGSRTISELMDILTFSDMSVTTRFHGKVLTLLAKKSILGICIIEKQMISQRKWDRKITRSSLVTLKQKTWSCCIHCDGAIRKNVLFHGKVER